ncbi:hypothetical protein LPB142_09140 [Rhodobacter xanthinilyticus]|uniref:Chemotaxis protein methyltransferase n=1 Tax=Rhodobacter xanthinilyticus TaxID=1850250 RepID=A0A1D9MC47_9RHOB|nr:protein-glutamate O-methyltransferase [Rhodobacter xanthinilyticus]AOZ69454.1 hypothetical protein LPB142_09140 [Rhodobacter xanthinilyticus]
MTQAFPPPSGHQPPSASELQAIAAILYEYAGIVINPNKSSMVQSRLAKRLRKLGLSDYQGYIALVKSEEGASERREMISALTTNVTHFFREKHHFDTLREKALPPLLARAKAGGRVRIWSAGSSNGQEAYTIAMVLTEMCSEVGSRDVRILASDIDPVMIARGTRGVYDSAALDGIPEPLQKKYTRPHPEGFEIVPQLRQLVSFRELNLHETWPMKGRFDIIFCRNVVIYFDQPAQTRLWQRFEACLNPGGWLFVGHSERVPLGGASRLETAGITTYRLPEEGAVQTIGESRWP